jgi:hypothetical protein
MRNQNPAHMIGIAQQISRPPQAKQRDISLNLGRSGQVAEFVAHELKRAANTREDESGPWHAVKSTARLVIGKKTPLVDRG